MCKMIKNTITETSTLMEFPSGLTIASSVPEGTWTVSGGGEVFTGFITNDELVGMPKAIASFGRLSVERAMEAHETEDSVLIQYWGRINFDLARFLCYMREVIQHPDQLPYPPETVSDEHLLAGAVIVASLAMGDHDTIRSTASMFGIDFDALRADIAEGMDDDGHDPQSSPVGDDWKPEGWDL